MKIFSEFARKFEHLSPKFACLGKKLEHFCSYSCKKLSCFSQSCQSLIWLLFRFVVFHVKPVWVLLTYLIVGSLVGYWALKVSKPRTTSFRPRDLDVFFTSVSAITVSSMSTVEMEVFSNTQLVTMTILMFVGGEVFTSMLRLQLARSKLSQNRQKIENRVGSNAVDVNHHTSSIHNNLVNQIELGLVTSPQLENEKPETDVVHELNCLDSESLKYNSIMALGYVVLGYILVVLVVGSGLVSLYLSLVPSGSRILKNKGLDIQTFSVFTTVSSFTNCGFIPTNENMVTFKGNPGLLLLLIPQILMGNTLYPPCLLFVIWVLKKATKRAEFGYILGNYRDLGYYHLLSGPRAALLVVTVFGFLLIQLALFCPMEWNSGVMDGLDAYQKIVSSLFQVVNSRHAGENVFEFSLISPAILVLFVVIMYLPSYTTFIPTNGLDQVSKNGKGSCQNRRTTFVDRLMLSQLSYLAIFIILICFTERQKMKDDPLNFSVLSIVLEVISAYGNVGYTTGYSCKLQLKPDSSCKDTWSGFVGRWSSKGKFILIIVMLFGRIKKFSVKGGRAWKLS
ncbi:Sodium transporter HKT1 [Morella rubra]|uniref:Sodium transporter HKT1 n=1 Tax=Morella rubra TaxID=262757 RepID=A0A6A1WPR1_9ROSI|nr:Sodium transporter HKT1 [Morella rubra]